MNAGSVAHTTILWMMTKEDLQQEDDEAAMITMLVESGYALPSSDVGSSNPISTVPMQPFYTCPEFFALKQMSFVCCQNSDACTSGMSGDH